MTMAIINRCRAVRTIDHPHRTLRSCLLIMETGNSLVIAAPLTDPAPLNQDNSQIKRTHFPPDFIFGCGTSAYQVEGAAAIGGKGLSVWDDFTLRNPGRIVGGTNGNVACDMYHRFKEDIRTMKNMGFDGYRFSISWPRILPGGNIFSGINREGIDYYNELIDTIIANGMKPCVTLFHWDTPYCLEKEYGGFLSKKIVDDFRAYAELCFWEFGDRVKWWSTLNEPHTYAVNGYVRGTFPPSEVSVSPTRVLSTLPPYRTVQRLQRTVPLTQTYSDGKSRDPAKDVYTVARNLLLAHSAAVHSYRTKFQKMQQGQIGIVLVSVWAVPYNQNSDDDKQAVSRVVDFWLGWFLEPILYGRYPQSMIDRVPPDNLAGFSVPELEKLKGSIDYLGFNYYTAYFVQHDPNPTGEGYDFDQGLLFSSVNVDGKLIGPPSGSSWLNIVPWGIYAHLKYLKDTYEGLPPVYITENGVSEADNESLTASASCVDPIRTKYHQDHLANILRAMNDQNVDVRGYFAWSWCDNFEWTEGYKTRFGLTYIDYMNNYTRHLKESAMWFAKFLMAPKEMSTAPVPLSLSTKRQIEAGDSENGSEKRPKV